MKFTVERDALNAALSSVIARTKSATTIPILSHVLIEAKDRSIRIVGHDLDACSIVTIPADVDQPGAIAVPADRLNKLTGGLPSGSQLVVAVEGDRATVRAGRANYRFAILPATDFPAALEPKNATIITCDGAHIARGFKTPAPCISPEKQRIYLQGICLHVKGKKLVACATDGHTLLRLVLPVDAPEFAQVIVPKTSCAEIADLAKAGEVRLEITQNLLAAEAGNRRFVTKLIDGTFPEYERVIPTGGSAPVKIDCEDLDAALARLVAACDPERSPVVRLSWDNGGEIIASLETQFGEGRETIECDLGDRKPGDVGMQVEYLRRMIDASGGETIHLHIDGPGDPVRVENPNAADLVGVLMPCRVQ